MPPYKYEIFNRQALHWLIGCLLSPSDQRVRTFLAVTGEDGCPPFPRLAPSSSNKWLFDLEITSWNIPSHPANRSNLYFEGPAFETERNKLRRHYQRPIAHVAGCISLTNSAGGSWVIVPDEAMEPVPGEGHPANLALVHALEAAWETSEQLTGNRWVGELVARNLIADLRAANLLAMPL